MRRMTRLLIPFALGVAALATAAEPDFSGKWLLDTSRGENLGMMSALTQTVVITQSPEALVLREASDFQGQKSSRELRYDLTGAAVRNPGAMGGDAETVARWVDGLLVVTWTSEGAVAGTQVVRTETRSLSADGRSMTVEIVRTGGKPVVMVYGKNE